MNRLFVVRETPINTVYERMRRVQSARLTSRLTPNYLMRVAGIFFVAAAILVLKLVAA